MGAVCDVYDAITSNRPYKEAWLPADSIARMAGWTRAGKLDAGEDRLACARRELLEETGYTAREWAHAGEMHPCIGYSDEFIDIWFARGLTAGQRQLDPGEFLEVFAASPTELSDWVREGHVTDGKTLACLVWLQNVLAGHWVLDWQGESAA